MSFSRLAIVNRGDAATRCLRAVREWRAESGRPLVAIALYTEPDRNAPFVRQADEALSLGAALRAPRGATPRLAYLDRARLLAALRATRADAVWPGWGFLAEDAAFAEQIEQRGIVLVGPGSAAMRALGDKIAAKRLAESCHVPVAPWSGGAVDREGIEAGARAVGFPLLLKAAGTGGGRGIRLVESGEDLGPAFERAVAEAVGSSGDGTVFLEALVPRARHIEVQIAADRHGRCVALGLRDCSIQRRRQKIVEEAPPPGLDAAVDGALRSAAVRLAKAAGYTGLGTVEFMLAADGRSFFFLEVNPRLQVEHGLTEVLTDLDLVKLQLDIACGAPLPGELPSERGHAIEVRLCAEDPAAEFAPAPGTIVLFEPPGGPGVRVDAGVGPGSVMPAEFDPLVAKVIAHAPSRPAALARMERALDEFRLVIDGGATNKGFLLDLLAADAVRRGGVDSEWLDRTLSELPPPAGAAEALMVAAVLVYQDERATARLNFFSDAAQGSATPEVAVSSGMDVELDVGGQPYRLHVSALGDWTYRIALDGRECLARLVEQEPHAVLLEVGEVRRRVTAARGDGMLRIEVDGRAHRVGRETGGLVRAAAPAVVISLEVAPGAGVAAGDRLGLLEAMKVEVPIYAPCAGTVSAVLARPNQRVAAGAPILQIQPTVLPAAPAAGAARIALPEWRDPMLMFFDPQGRPDFAAVAALPVPERERARRAFAAAVRRVLLGYDQRPDIDARLHALLDAPLPAGVAPEFLAELGDINAAVEVFADTEVLFSRQPETRADGTVEPANDTWLRVYLRRRDARGAGLPERMLMLLRRALAHYDAGDLAPGLALERALLRIHAAKARAAERYRLTGGLLRHLTQLARAGVDFSGKTDLGKALDACVAMRGTVPDSLADAAIEARYRIFELPVLRRRAVRAAAVLEHSLPALASPEVTVDLRTLGRFADSPAEVFERIAGWARSGDRAHRTLALQALVIRQYAPFAPASVAVLGDGPFAGTREGNLSPRERDRVRGSNDLSFESSIDLCRLDFPDRGVVLAALASTECASVVWEDLCTAAERETGGCQIPSPRPSPGGRGDPQGNGEVFIELFLPLAEPIGHEAVGALAADLLARRTPRAGRLCVTALLPVGRREHATFAWDGARFAACPELFGLHPETARRLELGRLEAFALERLPAAEGLYAFAARSRELPADERLFVLGEVRASLPGTPVTFHESAFVHAFNEAMGVLRALRAAHDRWRRRHWNRVTLFVRPLLRLRTEMLDRLVAALAPATRHLGIEKIVVRLALHERGGGEHEREIVVEPGEGGRVSVAWRDPHRDPLRAASDTERRIAAARRRGVVYPYDAIELFTAGGAHFEEFDLQAWEPRPAAASVAGRPAGGNSCGIVFGVIVTPTAKHPEGMTRVLVLSDPTRELGALAAPECDRLVAALDLAQARGVPLEWVAVSAGARIAMDSGTENLDATARVVRRIVEFTAAGGEINIIVAGVNVGAQSYFDALATMLPHTRGILVMLPGSAMVLTGRLALEASGGVAAADEVGIGGFGRIMGPNGEAQYYARNLAEAYGILLQHYAFTYRAPGEARPRRHATRDPHERSIAAAPYPAEEAEGFGAVGEIFDDAVNPGRKRPFAMRPVMQALIDQDGGRLERWAAMAGAETAIVWDAHLGGHAVCLIGIESRGLPRLGPRSVDGPAEWTGGTLFPLSSKKVARAIRAASGVRPVVLLANLSGFDGSPESMRTLQLEYGAEIARAVVEFEGPFVFVVVARYHGGAYVVFSRALSSNLYTIAIEGSYASVIGGAAAATAVFGREVVARIEADPRLAAARARLGAERDAERAAAARIAVERLREEIGLEKHGEVARAFDAVHTVERARAVGSLDLVVPLADLRRRVVERLG